MLGSSLGMGENGLAAYSAPWIPNGLFDSFRYCAGVRFVTTVWYWLNVTETIIGWGYFSLC